MTYGRVSFPLPGCDQEGCNLVVLDIFTPLVTIAVFHIINIFDQLVGCFCDVHASRRRAFSVQGSIKKVLSWYMHHLSDDAMCQDLLYLKSTILQHLCTFLFNMLPPLTRL